MQSSQVRKLAAIMFTDIAGYTSLMGKDESLALRLLNTNRQIHKTFIKQYHGQWLKEMGDGILVSFSTISDAIYCAGAIQAAVREVENLTLRIGIHMGEIVEDQNDVFGDGVNIASRIEALTPPGSIWVSETIYKNIRNRTGIVTKYAKTVKLKNVEDPVLIYSVQINEVSPPQARSAGMNKQVNSTWFKSAIFFLTLLTVIIITFGLIWKTGYFNARTGVLERSIAVMPFVNLSNDQENGHFAVGIQDAILNHLSKFEDLRVISRSSMEQYQDSKLSIPKIAEQVGVNYILEGSVQKAANQVRVTVQLINGTNDNHLWAETYDRDITEIFAVQSEIAQKIAQELKAILNPEIVQEIERIPTENMDAYEYYIRGLEIQNNAKEYSEVKRAGYLYQKAIQTDPDYADPYIGLARCYATLHWQLNNEKEVMDTVLKIINKAIELDPKSSDAYSYKGWFTFFGLNNLEEAEKYYAKAIELNPNNFEVYYTLARWIYPHAEKPDLVKALMYAKKAAKLSQGEKLGELLDAVGYIYLNLGMYEEAAEFYRQAIDLNPTWQGNSAQWWLNIIQGKFDQALGFAQKNVELYPEDNKSYLELARTYVYLQQYDTALTLFDKWFSMYSDTNLNSYEYRVYSDEYKYALIQTGKKEKALQQIQEKIKYSYEMLELRSFNEAGGIFYDLVRLNTLIGNKKEALKYLEKLEQAEFAFGSISWAMVDPLVADLRDEPEFKDIIEKGWKRKWELQEQVRKLDSEEDLKVMRNR